MAGGSGVAPLMAMLRHRAAAKANVPAVLLYSSRTFEDIIYREELDRLAASGDGLRVVHTLTRGAAGGLGRRDAPHRSRHAGQRRHRRRASRPKIFICGPTPLVESAARSLQELGHEPGLIKTERFGPTGG